MLPSPSALKSSNLSPFRIVYSALKLVTKHLLVEKNNRHDRHMLTLIPIHATTGYIYNTVRMMWIEPCPSHPPVTSASSPISGMHGNSGPLASLLRALGKFCCFSNVYFFHDAIDLLRHGRGVLLIRVGGEVMVDDLFDSSNRLVGKGFVFEHCLKVHILVSNVRWQKKQSMAT